MRSTDPGQAFRVVLGRIDAACGRSGRNPDQVRLVAVSKTRPPAAVLELARAGQVLFGENRVQEALGKMDAPDLDGLDLSWHLIGHLQKNKAGHVAGRFDLVHTIDSVELAVTLDRRSGSCGCRQPVLLQVNQAGEATKNGVSEENLEELARKVAALTNLDLRGLMTIPPMSVDPEDSRRWFSGLRELRDRLEGVLEKPLPDLSMGMSDSYEAAVEEGATLVRVGTALFGPRT
jgi:pyridoxal phosphate enzyme (YggS family)